MEMELAPLSSRPCGLNRWPLMWRAYGPIWTGDGGGGGLAQSFIYTKHDRPCNGPEEPVADAGPRRLDAATTTVRRRDAATAPIWANQNECHMDRDTTPGRHVNGATDGCVGRMQPTGRVSDAAQPPPRTSLISRSVARLRLSSFACSCSWFSSVDFDPLSNINHNPPQKRAPTKTIPNRKRTPSTWWHLHGDVDHVVGDLRFSNRHMHTTTTSTGQ